MIAPDGLRRILADDGPARPLSGRVYKTGIRTANVWTPRLAYSRICRVSLSVTSRHSRDEYDARPLPSLVPTRSTLTAGLRHNIACVHATGSAAYIFVRLPYSSEVLARARDLENPARPLEMSVWDVQIEQRGSKRGSALERKNCESLTLVKFYNVSLCNVLLL